MRNDDFVEVDCDLVKETDAAFLIETADGDQHWIPKSLCDGFEDGVLMVVEWKAEQEGLV